MSKHKRLIHEAREAVERSRRGFGGDPTALYQVEQLREAVEKLCEAVEEDSRS